LNLKEIHSRIEVLEAGRLGKTPLSLIREIMRYKRDHDSQYPNLADLSESDQLQIKYFAYLENPISGLDQMAQIVCEEILKKS